MQYPFLKMRISFIALMLALMASVVVASCGSEPSTENDSVAPDFTLPAVNRTENITLSDFRNEQNVILVFYRGFF